MIDSQGYGGQNCLGDTNPSGQFGASIQTFGWGVTANSMKASNVCAMLKIGGQRAALAYLAGMDRNAHRALVNNGMAVTRAQIEALALRAASPGGVYSLTLRGDSRQVMFRHQDAPAFEARPLVPVANPQAGDFYLATLKLMTV